MDFLNKRKKYLYWFDNKYHNESYFTKSVWYNEKSGLYLHKEVNYLFNTILLETEKPIVDEYYSNLSKNESREIPTMDFLHYVPFISVIVGTRYCSYMGGMWSALFEYDLKRSEEVMNYIVSKYAENDYDKADTFTYFAKAIYTKYEKDTYHLELVAEYGLRAFALKDFWFNIWEREDYGIKLDFFWPTLCNVLRKLNKLDEAIEIATFAYEHNAYDKTQGGWKARLDKLKNARNKKNPN